MRFPQKMGPEEARTQLKDRLFYGIAKSIWDSVRYLYDKEKATYSKLLAVTRNAETEGSEKKTNDGTGFKMKAATCDCNDISKEMIVLKQKVSEMRPIIIAQKYVSKAPKSNVNLF